MRKLYHIRILKYHFLRHKKVTFYAIICGIISRMNANLDNERLVLMLHSTQFKSWRDKLDGVNRFMRERRPDWRLQVVDYSAESPSPKTLTEFWRPLGFIVHGVFGRWHPSLSSPSFRHRHHVVFLDCNPPVQRKPHVQFRVSHDPHGTAELAIRTFLGISYAHFAFVGTDTPCFWSDERRKAFRAELQKAFGSLSLREFWPVPAISDGAVPFDNRKRLMAWLLDLPKPCGVFAVNDARACEIAGLCRLAKIRIPEDVALIGVDDDDVLCENTSPTITSIRPDYEEAGFHAADLMNRAIEGNIKPPREIYYGTCGITRRLSTRILAREDRLVTNALEFIRRNAILGADVPAVVSEMGCSRRSAERRFRAATGHTILDEISEIRFARIFELIRDPSIPLDDIADRAGFGNGNYLKNLFKARFGTTLSARRKSLIRPQTSNGT